jgi:uncharacterized protein (TIGR02598 family)
MRTSSSSAFSLVEVVIAMGVAAFCLVAMLGLIPSGVKSVKAATDQTGATTVLDEVVTDLRSTPVGSNSSPTFGISLPAAGTASAKTSTNLIFSETGSMVSSNDFNARYVAAITLSNSSAFITTALIQVRWPPVVGPSNSLGTIETMSTILRQ